MSEAGDGGRLAAIRTRCARCGEITRRADAFGDCPECAAEVGDDGSYTLEGAIDEVLFPMVRTRLRAELATLRAALADAVAAAADKEAER